MKSGSSQYLLPRIFFSVIELCDVNVFKSVKISVEIELRKFLVDYIIGENYD